MAAEGVVEGRMDQFQGIARGIADRRPREAEFVIDAVDLSTGGIQQSDAFTASAESPGPWAEGGGKAVLLAQGGRILCEDEELPRGDGCTRRQDELRAAGESPTGDIHRLGVVIEEFNELDPFLVHVGG